jgi:hypothetical protein
VRGFNDWICDGCEARVPLTSDGALPVGWIVTVVWAQGLLMMHGSLREFCPACAAKREGSK